MSKCPICEIEYSNNHRMCDELRCTDCYWDLTIYPLTPDGLRQEQENKIEWARDSWIQLQHLKDVDEYQGLLESNDDLQERLELETNKQDKLKEKIKKLKNQLGYLLSEPDRLALRREQLLSESDYRNSDPEYKTDRTFTANLPFKIAEVIKNNLIKNERGNNLNVWLKKVIIDAAIKEGWLDRL